MSYQRTKKSLEGVLHSDDKIYLRYVDLYHSLKEIEEARLEVTPDTLLSKALPLKQYTKSKAMKERLFGLLKPIMAPKPAISFAASIVIILFIVLNIGQEQSNDLDSDSKETIDNILKSFGSTDMSPTVFNGQEVFFSKKTIEFIPDLKKSTQLVLISFDDDTLLNKLITEKTSSLELSNDLIEQLPLKLVLISGDSIKNKIISQ